MAGSERDERAEPTVDPSVDPTVDPSGTRRRRVASGAPGPLVEPGPRPFTARAGEDRILTVPNLITLVRLCFLPVFVWLLLGRDDRVAAAVLLGLLGATDWVDGWVARRFNQTSRFGSMFDPTADRLMFFVSLTAIIIDGGVPTWFAVVVLVREVVVGVITAVLVLTGNPPADVTWWGKAGTFGLMFAFPFLLAGSATGFPPAPVFTVLGWIAAVPGLVLSLIAFVRYFPLWAESLREGRILREQARRV
jgi:cardiolipin synthase (CMP-forming)